jgi:hypothetical protein
VRYESGPALRDAIEQRLKGWAGDESARIARFRKRITFERFLARLTEVAPGAWVVKGGFALDLRLHDQARATKDLDIEWRSAESELLEALLSAAEYDAGDFFDFQVERVGVPEDPLGGSHRFRLTASLAGRRFETVLLDAGFQTGPEPDTEQLTSQLLEFAELDPVRVEAIPLEQHLAEKVHAYTRLYGGSHPSTRTKDLVDIVLIATLYELDGRQLVQRLEATFDLRATHILPGRLPSPPEDWGKPYASLAAAIGIDVDLGLGYRRAVALLDPILSQEVGSAHWDPSQQQWGPVSTDAP